MTFVFGAVLDRVQLRADSAVADLDWDMPLPVARILLANLEAAIAAAEAHRPAAGVADLLNS